MINKKLSRYIAIYCALGLFVAEFVGAFLIDDMGCRLGLVAAILPTLYIYTWIYFKAGSEDLPTGTLVKPLDTSKSAAEKPSIARELEQSASRDVKVTVFLRGRVEVVGQDVVLRDVVGVDG
jgi:hypothetical protein